MTVRMDSQLKSSFDEMCSQFGMSANTAMNIFAKAVVQRGRIPFEIRGDKTSVRVDGYKAFQQIRALADEGTFPDMTLDEINEEIRRYRQGE